MDPHVLVSLKLNDKTPIYDSIEFADDSPLKTAYKYCTDNNLEISLIPLIC